MLLNLSFTLILIFSTLMSDISNVLGTLYHPFIICFGILKLLSIGNIYFIINDKEYLQKDKQCYKIIIIVSSILDILLIGLIVYYMTKHKEIIGFADITIIAITLDILANIMAFIYLSYYTNEIYYSRPIQLANMDSGFRGYRSIPFQINNELNYSQNFVATPIMVWNGN